MNKERAVIVIAVIVCLIFLIGEAVQAEESLDRSLSPYFLILSEADNVDHFPLKSTDVRADISGVIADLTVTQVYENMGVYPIHARYIFPASTRAATAPLQKSSRPTSTTAARCRCRKRSGR